MSIVEHKIRLEKFSVQNTTFKFTYDKTTLNPTYPVSIPRTTKVSLLPPHVKGAKDPPGSKTKELTKSLTDSDLTLSWTQPESFRRSLVRYSTPHPYPRLLVLPRQHFLHPMDHTPSLVLIVRPEEKKVKISVPLTPGVR